MSGKENPKTNSSASDDAPEVNGDAELWDLLENARPVQPNPFFSRNVLREVRLQQSSKTDSAPLFAWLRSPRLLAALGALMFFALGFLMLDRSDQAPDMADTTQDIPAETWTDPAIEMESIEKLGSLMAVSDPGSLSDDALMALLVF